MTQSRRHGLLSFRCLAPFLLLGAAVLSASCVQAPVVPEPASAAGDDRQNAIEVCMPAGERAYLSRLVCSNGESPSFRRRGSFGSRHEFPKNLPAAEEQALLERNLRGSPLQPGEPDYHIIDGFEVSCGGTIRMVFLDMYHCEQPVPTVAPRGFTLRPVKQGS